MPARPSAASRRPDHHQELLELLEARDRRTEEWREETRQHREEMRTLDSRIIRVRDILAGRDHHQEEIPGTEVVALPPVKKPKKAKGSKKFPLGTGLTEVCTECGLDAGSHAGQSCPDRLRFVREPKNYNEQRATIPIGTYRLTFGEGALWSAEFRPFKGPVEPLAQAVTERDAKKSCDHHRLHGDSDAEIPELKTGTKAEAARSARALEKRLHHEDDEPARTLPVTDEVEGVTYEAKPKCAPELLRFPGLKDGQTHADLVVPGRAAPERYTIEKIAGGKFRWFITGKKYSTPFASFVAARNAAEADARRRMAGEAA